LDIKKATFWSGPSFYCKYPFFFPTIMYNLLFINYPAQPVQLVKPWTKDLTTLISGLVLKTLLSLMHFFLICVKRAKCSVIMRWREY